MIIQKTFIQWLRQFDSKLHIEEIVNEVVDEEGEIKGRQRNPDVDSLYWGKKRLCSLPRGLKEARFWADGVSDKRSDARYETSDGIAHRSLSGIGTYLLMRKIITTNQFKKHFLTSRNREILEMIERRGEATTKSGIIIK